MMKLFAALSFIVSLSPAWAQAPDCDPKSSLPSVGAIPALTDAELRQRFEAFKDTFYSRSVPLRLNREQSRFATDHGLTDGEAIAIHYYTRSGYGPINRVARVAAGWEEVNARNPVRWFLPEAERRPEFEATRQLMRSGLAKLPDYRGPATRAVEWSAEMASQFAKKYVRLPYFVSAAQGFEPARTFIDRGTQVAILSQHGKSVRRLSASEFENEILFADETCFEVKELDTAASALPKRIRLEETESSRCDDAALAPGLDRRGDKRR